MPIDTPTAPAVRPGMAQGPPLSLRLPPALEQRLRALARTEGQPLNQLVLALLHRGLRGYHARCPACGQGQKR